MITDADERDEDAVDLSREDNVANSGPSEADGESEEGGNYSYTEEQKTKNVEEKEWIALAVTERWLNQRGQPVFLDAGSTVWFLAKRLFELEAKGQRLGHTILTNNMLIFEELKNIIDDVGGPQSGKGAGSLNLNLTAGQYDFAHEALFGDLAKSSLEEFYPRTIVMGVSGLRFKVGAFYHAHTPEGVIKRTIAERETLHRIVIADSSKLGKPDSFLAADWYAMASRTQRLTVVTTKPPEGDRGPTERWETERNRCTDLIDSDPALTDKLRLLQVTAGGKEAFRYGNFDAEFDQQ
jgi:DeoR/GlpR family transcriptional regulator of sugar metabolism